MSLSRSPCAPVLSNFVARSLSLSLSLSHSRSFVSCTVSSSLATASSRSRRAGILNFPRQTRESERQGYQIRSDSLPQRIVREDCPRQRLSFRSSKVSNTTGMVDSESSTCTSNEQCSGKKEIARLVAMTRKKKDPEETNRPRSGGTINGAEDEEDEKGRNRWTSWSGKLSSRWYKLREAFEESQGFRLSDLATYERFVRLMYRPSDPASLGVARALFGLCMVLDVVEERGFADIDLKWGDPNGCHFPLIHGMESPPLPIMILIYATMWIGAFGIMLGFCFKLACACFAIPYWYIFLLDKSFWNNHTYLYGIVAILFWGTGANRYLALDSRLSEQRDARVPLWNYFILRFQFFALYFIAGLKKSSREWLEGYAMTNLSRHWVFDPFKSFLTTQQTDFLVVHWFGFLFDLTVGFFMLFPKTRIPAMVFCTAFHSMNSRLFSIGMFPYVCLATMPLFCNVDWPRKAAAWLVASSVDATDHQPDEITTSPRRISGNERCEVTEENDKKSEDEREERVRARRDRRRPRRVTRRQKLIVALLLLHVALQFFLPYSHFITKGYNNWVPGLYGYSWDMMVHTWDIILIVIKVRDNANNEDLFVNPRAWVQNDRWAKHGDMVRQHARCLRDNLLRRKERVLGLPEKAADFDKWARLSSNLSVYVDVWCSLNGRFQQRIFDPNVDMLTADWHPFEPVSYLVPLLSEFSSYRYKLDDIQRHVYSWSDYTDVFFVADYPGMRLENYISEEFSNVSVSVLEGSVAYSEEGKTSETGVSKGDRVAVRTGKFHTVRTTGARPSCYMYTYTNRTRQETGAAGPERAYERKEAGPIFGEFKYKWNAWLRALGRIADSFFYLVYDVPMTRRVSDD